MCFRQKKPIKVQVFRLLSDLMKVHPIPHAIFKPQGHFSMSWIFCLNLIYFGQKEPIDVKFSDFWVVAWKFTDFVLLCLKPQVSLSLKFRSLFSVTSDNSSVLFQVKLYMVCTLIGSFCSKYVKFQLQKFTGLMSHKLNSDAKYEEKPICCFKNVKKLVNFVPSI